MLRSIMDKQWCTGWVVLEKDQSPVYVLAFVCVRGYQWKDCLHLDSSDTYFLHVYILIFSIVHRFLEVQHLVSEECWVKTFLLCFFITEPSWVTLGSRSQLNYPRMVSLGILPKLGTPFLEAYILFRTGRKWGFLTSIKKSYGCVIRGYLGIWGQKLGYGRMSSDGLLWQEVYTSTHP